MTVSARGEARRFATFLALGAVAALSNWLARFPLSTVLPYLAAVAVAYAVGMVVAFVLYSRYVFPGVPRSRATQVTWFVLINLAGAAQVVGVAWAMRTQVLPGLGVTGAVADALAHAVAIGVPTISSYFGHKLLTFRAR